MTEHITKISRDEASPARLAEYREPDEMVEAGARAAYDRAFMKHAPEYVDRWDNLVASHAEAADSWRDVTRAVLSAVFGTPGAR